MNSRIFRVSLVITMTLLFVVTSILTYRQLSFASDIPDTPENQSVIDALEEAITVLDLPFEELDLTKLSKVLINDPNYAQIVSPDELTELMNYTRKVQGEAALDNFGYLTAMQTKRMNQQNGARLLRAAREKAASENREVTREEMQQLTEQNFGLEPFIPDSSEHDQSEPFKRILRYFSIKIEKDRAEVFYDDMVKTRKAILLQVNGQWYVADIS